MGLADWVNRYIVEVKKPAAPPAGAPAPAPKGAAPAAPAKPADVTFVPTQKRAADLLPEEPDVDDPEIESLLAEARGSRPTPAPAPTAAKPAAAAAPTAAKPARPAAAAAPNAPAP